MNESPPRRPSVWFQAASLVAFLFVMTVLIMVAALFSDPDSPLNAWFNRYGLWLFVGEIGTLSLLVFLGMIRDQKEQK